MHTCHSFFRNFFVNLDLSFVFALIYRGIKIEYRKLMIMEIKVVSYFMKILP